MNTARTIAKLHGIIAHFREARESVALIPTMGALHAGHLSLVRLARRRADRVVVSIFVNPSQFAPHEDFASYPRNFAADVAALAKLETDLIWAPTAAVMYPSANYEEAVVIRLRLITRAAFTARRPPGSASGCLPSLSSPETASCAA